MKTKLVFKNSKILSNRIDENTFLIDGESVYISTMVQKLILKGKEKCSATKEVEVTEVVGGFFILYEVNGTDKKCPCIFVPYCVLEGQIGGKTWIDYIEVNQESILTWNKQVKPLKWNIYENVN